MSTILIIGATGRTGSLTLEKLLGLSLTVVIGGRNREKLDLLSRKFKVRSIETDIANKNELTAIFRDFKVVINCIGPFTRLGYIPLEAAIAAKTNYVDSAWEQEYLFKIDSYSDIAVESDVAVISGLGVSPGISDLMVSLAYREFDTIDSIAVNYVEGMKNRFSYGTLTSTAISLQAKSLSFSEGRFIPVGGLGKSKKVSFQNRFGNQTLISYPGGDIVNIPKYIKTDSVEHFIGIETATKLLLVLRKIPFEINSPMLKIIFKIAEKIQSFLFWGNRGFTIMIEINGWKAGRKTTEYVSVCHDEDPYVTTAKLIAHGVKYLVEADSLPGGILSPGRVFDSARLLDAIGVRVYPPTVECRGDR